MCLAISKAAIPLRAYAKKFTPHLSLLNKDIKEYIQWVKNTLFSFSPSLLPSLLSSFLPSLSLIYLLSFSLFSYLLLSLSIFSFLSLPYSIYSLALFLFTLSLSLFTHTLVHTHREFSEGEHTSLQIKQFIDEHLRLKAHVEATFPQYITIGPFYINVDTVRTGLAKKHKDISQALLDFLATKLRRDADMVWYSYIITFVYIIMDILAIFTCTTYIVHVLVLLILGT